MRCYITAALLSSSQFTGIRHKLVASALESPMEQLPRRNAATGARCARRRGTPAAGTVHRRPGRRRGKPRRGRRARRLPALRRHPQEGRGDPQAEAHRPRFPRPAPCGIGQGCGHMIARNGLTPTRRRRTVARPPMQDRFPDSPTGPAKAGVPSSSDPSRWRPMPVPERPTDRIAPSPGMRTAILSPYRTLLLAASFNEISQPWEADQSLT